jgi:hypothetical protein
LLLNKLDKLQTPMNGLFCTGNLMLMNGPTQLIGIADIETQDHYKGNKYVAIVKDGVVLTVVLFPSTTSESTIIDKANSHIKRYHTNTSGELYEYDKVIYIDGKKARKIDLLKSDTEFMKEYPLTSLSTQNVPALSNIELEFSDDNKVEDKYSKSYYEMSPSDVILDKEYVIKPNMEILWKTNDGYKKRKIIDIVIDESARPKRFFVVFADKPAHKVELKVGKTFIISPKLKTENLISLFKKFNINTDDINEANVHFMGKIVKLQHYDPIKNGSAKSGGFIYHSIGVVITPTRFFID